ncbi:thioredoxin family protein [Christiangramia sabulilitoris]|uniref:thioredoxin family protein n=1 Tax=Christiangramia sabulilitoris TaxID=2583991 RepID=UPI00140A3035|nr:thioredoxin family protein [Christiangramia sabulilitoris]
MKKLFLLLFLSTPNLYATNWYTDLVTAQKVAIASNKLILVDFWANWCGPCKKMDRDVWSEEEVKDVLANYVPLRVDFDTQRQLVNEYGVRGIPYVVIMDANGKVLHNNLGYTDKMQTLRILEKYRLNTSFMQLETAYFNRQPSYSTALRLAQKYLDFSLYLEDPEVRHTVLALAKEYLSETEDLLDSKQSNYNMMEQKIKLLEANVDLYEGNYRKVGRFLEKKIDEEDLRKYNWGIYCFLNYCLFKEEGDEENIQKWKNEMNQLKNPEVYWTRYSKLVASKD